MAAPPPGSIPITGTLYPSDLTDLYPTYDSLYGLGSAREVATLADRDAIPAGRRRWGMTVYVQSEGNTYRLNSDGLTWTNEGAAGGLPPGGGIADYLRGDGTWQNLESAVLAFGGVANGLATLDAGGKIPVAQIPALSIVETFVVPDEPARLALVAQQGDVAVQTDIGATFILQTEPASVAGNWVELQFPAAVSSVNGFSGAVVLTADDVQALRRPSGIDGADWSLVSSPARQYLLTVRSLEAGASEIQFNHQREGFLQGYSRLRLFQNSGADFAARLETLGPAASVPNRLTVSEHYTTAAYALTVGALHPDASAVIPDGTIRYESGLMQFRQAGVWLGLAPTSSVFIPAPAYGSSVTNLVNELQALASPTGGLNTKFAIGWGSFSAPQFISVGSTNRTGLAGSSTIYRTALAGSLTYNYAQTSYDVAEAVATGSALVLQQQVARLEDGGQSASVVTTVDGASDFTGTRFVSSLGFTAFTLDSALNRAAPDSPATTVSVADFGINTAGAAIARIYNQIQVGDVHPLILPQNGMIRYNTATNLFEGYEDGVWQRFSNVASSLNDLTDVVLTAPTNGDIIQYNGTNWLNINAAGGFLPAGTTTNSTLRWNGTNWVENENVLILAASSVFPMIDNIQIAANAFGSVMSVGNLVLVGSDGILSAAITGLTQLNGEFGISLDITSPDNEINFSSLLDTAFQVDGSERIRLSTTGIGVFGTATVAQQAIPTSYADAFTKLQSYGWYQTGTITPTLGWNSDVVFTTPVNGDILQYDGTNWINFTPPGGLLPASTIENALLTANASGGWVQNRGMIVVPGTDPSASGTGAVAWGTGTAGANGATAFGVFTTATGQSSLAAGTSSVASALGAFAFGSSVNATNSYAFAIGASTSASGQRAFAQGINTVASGNNSAAFGNTTTASGVSAFTFGANTRAVGNNSLAAGNGSAANANLSAAYGQFGQADAFAEYATGSYPTLATTPTSASWVWTDRLFSIGNGINGTSRNSAFIIRKNGVIEIGHALSTVDNAVLTNGTTANIGSTTNALYRIGSTLYWNGNSLSLPAPTADNRILSSSSGSWVENPTWIVSSTSFGNTDSPFFSDAEFFVQVSGTSTIFVASTDFGFGPQLYFEGDSLTTFSAFFARANTIEITTVAGNGLFLTPTDLRINQPVRVQNSILSTGATGNPTLLSGGSGAGTRFFWYPAKNAFRAGFVTGTTWDDSNIGVGSTAFGSSTLASGVGSFAIGVDTVASGTYSFAGGDGCEADFLGFSFGQNNIANGTTSVAFGASNTAFSFVEAVFGAFSETYTPVSVVGYNWNDQLFRIGNGRSSARSNALVVWKDAAIQIGRLRNPSDSAVVADATVSSGRPEVLENIGGVLYWNGSPLGAGINWSTAQGTGAENVVGNFNSVVWGGATNTATGLYSFVAAGSNNSASGPRSFASGFLAAASGSNAFVGGGNNNLSSGFSSATIGGIDNQASGTGSLVSGVNNRSNVRVLAILGQFSVTATGNADLWVWTEQLMKIGNGVDDTNRSDAITFYKNATIEIGHARDISDNEVLNDASDALTLGTMTNRLARINSDLHWQGFGQTIPYGPQVTVPGTEWINFQTDYPTIAQALSSNSGKRIVTNTV